MATNQTENYALNQWELSDSVVMADFNADNQKLDSALMALSQKIDTTAAQLAAAIPHVQVGTYVGTGTYGEDHPNTLTFDFEPKLVIINNVIFLDQIVNEHESYNLIAVRGARRTIAYFFSGADTKVTLNWSGNALIWYSNGSSGEQGNISEAVYHYIAIG